MAIISTFELLLKRIGPPMNNGIPMIFTSPFRRNLQGYYLTISNPNNRRVSLALQATVPKLKDNTFPEIDRTLVGGNAANHVYAYDRTGCSSNVSAAPRELLGSMFQVSSTSSSTTFRTSLFILEPFQTGLVNVVPNPAFVPQNMDPQLEIRGYIEILQPQILEGFLPLRFRDPDPVELVFTPEIRGTFLDDGFPSNTQEFDFDQSNYALPTATGAAQITIAETFNPFFVIFDPVENVASDLSGVIDLNKINGKENFLGEIILDEKSLEYIDKSMNKANVKGMSVREVKERLETVINQLKINKAEKQ